MTRTLSAIKAETPPAKQNGPPREGLQDFCKRWFKGPEGKVHDKETEENDSWILDMYDACLEQVGDEAANLPYPIPDKKAGKGKADNE